jgi:hypothetical protein
MLMILALLAATALSSSACLACFSSAVSGRTYFEQNKRKFATLTAFEPSFGLMSLLSQRLNVNVSSLGRTKPKPLALKALIVASSFL